MSRPAIPLAPIVKTQFAHRLTHGGAAATRHRECWGAKTTDGTWDLEREDSPGTPWLLYHHETMTLVTVGGTMRYLRWYVAAGHAQAELSRLQAHERGEHTAGRDPRCGRC